MARRTRAGGGGAARASGRVESAGSDLKDEVGARGGALADAETDADERGDEANGEAVEDAHADEDAEDGADEDADPYADAEDGADEDADPYAESDEGPDEDAEDEADEDADSYAESDEASDEDGDDDIYADEGDDGDEGDSLLDDADADHDDDADDIFDDGDEGNQDASSSDVSDDDGDSDEGDDAYSDDVSDDDADSDEETDEAGVEPDADDATGGDAADDEAPGEEPGPDAGNDDERDALAADDADDDDRAFPPGSFPDAEDMAFAPGRGRIGFTVAPRRKVPRWFVQALARRVARAARRLGIGSGAAVTCHLVDDPAIARLNAEHMGKVGPTDVLSFPAGPLGPGEGEGTAAGDVVISVDAVRRQARARLGISGVTERTGVKRQVLWGLVIETGPKEPVLPDMVENSAEAAAALDEATVLAVHGLCHLLGHDHGRRGEARAMHRAERRALQAADTPDVPRPYGIDARRERRVRRTR
ncbi:ssRNA-specific RNase YbeY, 16S rRNA maturation enzyme [Nannocystis exedens]|uniref:Endoribonuclease YbeY n=1 Tax=Nannocystis exedens TaxID=54 RepID=A0A1I1SWU7_9BACT|nr:Endoribonuclease YbeY [Nannocystis exedens]SFD50821.1 ssRNA-specific RNase YbeY, 16S rRNA maturation enzyme [Nannocystis exedens]